ncbi:MAG: hypothetical protein ACI8WT_004735 [Clostridium sp.]|jgi:hypothetical protein
MSKFLNAKELDLINGGYVSNKEGKPVTNKEFIKLQKKAEWLVVLAAKMKGKNFNGEVAVNINDLMSETTNELNSVVIEEFVKMPKAPKDGLAAKLAKEAMDFVGFHKETAVSTHINSKLQEFRVINEFELHGLFFTSGVSKLNKIYTMAEITAAATAVYTVVGA